MLDRPSPTTDTWTPARIKTLTDMWLDGASAGEIAFTLGITRNSAMGKVSRLKLKRGAARRPGTPKPSRQKRTPKEVGNDQRVRNSLIAKRRTRSEILADAKAHRPADDAPKVNGNRGVAKANAIVHRVLTAEKPRILPVPKDLPEPGKRLRLVDLNHDECRWCEGDPMTSDHSFCGRPVKPGSSWCPDHHVRVFPSRT